MKRAGFTIIEVMLVIVILVTLSAIVVPIFDLSLPQTVLESEARKLASELNDIQQMAVFSNKTYGLCISASNSSITVYSGDSSGTIQQEYIYYVDDPVEISGTSYTEGMMYFNPMGGPSDGGSITLRNGQSRTMTVIIAPLTGKISISGTEDSGDTSS